MRIGSRPFVVCAALLVAQQGCDTGDDDGGGGGALAGATTGTCAGDLCLELTGGGPPTLCTGVVASCEAQSDERGCDEIAGCEALLACVGTAADCDLLSQGACGGQIGCYWSYVIDGPATCTGAAATCAELGSTACESQQGCHVEAACTGGPEPCSAFFEATDCALQPGCVWQ